MATKDKPDCLVVVGYSFNHHWQLPPHLIKRLGLVARDWQQHRLPIVVCGAHSIHWDWEDITPPLRECDLMKQSLIGLGVSPGAILCEQQSRDTIGNIYWLKTMYLIPHQWKGIVLYCADHHKTRVKFLCKKILGPAYRIKLIATPSPGGSNQAFQAYEAKILSEQKTFLAGMPDGNEDWLTDKLYTDPYYADQKESERRSQDRQATIYLANFES